MRVPAHVEIAQIVDGVGNAIGPDDVRQFIPTERVEDLDVHELGTVQRELRIGDSLENLHPRPGSEHQLDDRGGVQDGDHDVLAPFPPLPQDFARRGIEVNGWQLGDSREQFFARRLLQ